MIKEVSKARDKKREKTIWARISYFLAGFMRENEEDQRRKDEIVRADIGEREG